MFAKANVASLREGQVVEPGVKKKTQHKHIEMSSNCMQSHFHGCVFRWLIFKEGDDPQGLP